MTNSRLPTVILFCVTTFATGARAAGPSADGVEFFEKKIRPVLIDRCYSCHSVESTKSKGGLLLDTRDATLKGGENGPAVVPGDVARSKLIEAVRYENPDLQMPPKGKRLTDAEVADLVAWVKMGAPDPRGGPSVASGPYDFAAARQQWAYRPPQAPALPDVRDTAWGKTPVDRFILAKLEEKGLAPAPPAERRVLLRRATFDLTGLPPTDAEVEAFANDAAPDAFARVVDRLLATEAYGQRWGRHWLDVVRYTDLFDTRSLKSADPKADVPHAWRYRDWVIDAFNRDLPYDQFVAQQIAGDLLPGVKRAEGIVATGVYVIGEWGGGDADKDKMMTDIVDDQVDVTGRAFLGMTLACARCHDHKFDPIPTADYYALAGIFFSSHILPSPGAKTDGSPILRIPLNGPDDDRNRAAIAAKIASAKEQIERATDEALVARATALLPQTAQYLQAAGDYARRPADERGVTPAQFAAARNLDGYALSRWAALLDAADDVKLLAEPVRSIGGVKGFDGWRNPGPSGTPVATANATDKPVAVQTFALPPRGVALHPSSDAAVAVGWRSPISGKVSIRGRVADVDPTCGDGIAWRVTLRAGDGGVRLLRSGAVVNGGGQAFADGKGGESLDQIDLRAGDVIELAVLPKAEYTCDTTVVDLEIAERGGGSRSWNLSRELSSGLLAGNPHADALGYADVWRLYELPLKSTEQPAPPPDPVLARWITLARDSGTAPSDVASAASAVAAKLLQGHRQLLPTPGAERSDGPDLAGAPHRAAAEGLDPVVAWFLDPRGSFWAATRKDDAALPAPAKAAIAKARAEVKTLERQAKDAVPVAHGLQEGGTPGSIYAGFKDGRILQRGRYDRPGDVVPRRFPQLLAGDSQSPIAQGSGRRELAQWIASPDNPLTARVMVNRIWQHHFGRGIVATPNNFGKLGVPPTHPELLDHLAVEFVRSGWSVKAMHRAMMLSSAYQQSSTASAQALQADPENLLLSRFPRRKLEAEALRDAMLAVADRLDPAAGGPAFADIDTPRRTVFLRTIRSDRSGYRMLFDAADPQGIVEARVDSTVAPQALFLLNSPFAIAQAKALAERAARQPGDVRARIAWVYRRLFARNPSAREVEVGLAALGGANANANANANAEANAEAWERYCQVLLCSNEFLYVD